MPLSRCDLPSEALSMYQDQEILRSGGTKSQDLGPQGTQRQGPILRPVLHVYVSPAGEVS